MKTKSKILLSIILLIFIIGIVTTTVVFAGLADMESGSGQNQIGKKYSYSLNTLEGSINTYCIQHSGSLSRHYSVTGEIKAYIAIDGRKANIYIDKDKTPKTITCDLNAQIAYILSKKQGYGYLHNYSVAQVVLWRNVNSWFNKLAGAFDTDTDKNVFLQFKDSANNNGGSYGTNCQTLKSEAQDYAESLTTQASGEDKVTLSITDKTDKDDLSVGDTANYMRVGPFQYKFSGDLQELKVKGDGNYLSNSDFRLIKYHGTKAQVVSTSDIKSKDEFYVDISKSVNIEKTMGLYLKVGTSVNNKDVIKARIWLLKAGSYQNLLHCTTSSGGDSQPYSKDDYFEYDITTKVSARIKKVDDRDETKTLKGVGFTFSTEIKIWEWTGSVKDTKSCTHSYPGSPEHSDDGEDEDGNPIPCTHIPTLYEHPNNTCPWTRNIYELKTKTVYLNKDGEWEQTSTPYVWRTDSKGEIPLDNITYNTISVTKTNETYDGQSETVDAVYLDKTHITATEVDNPKYGYQNKENNTYTVEVGTEGKMETAKLKNHQDYVKLSGYVWLDEGDEKTTVRNDEFDSNFEKGIENTGKDGVKVYLKDKNGNIVKKEIKDGEGKITGYVDQVTVTSEVYKDDPSKDLYPEISGGEYIFEDVDLDELEAGNYHVEFEYCGINYQAVASNVNIKNGSKAEETTSRDILNTHFSRVDSNYGQQELNVDGVKVGYNGISNHESTPKEHKEGHSGCEVYASTKTGNFEYNLYTDSGFKPTNEEIRYINLGLYKKAQTDYALVQDLYNVRVAVNGFNHIYKYATVRYNGDNVKDDSWNVGVKFQNNRGTYNRAIYNSDKEYEAPNHKDNELKVYVTYKVALKNQSPYMGRINNIINYCDNRYNLIAAGTTIDGNDKITGDIGYSQKMNYDSEYSKYVIYTNQVIYAGEAKYIYLQFEMDREAVLAIVNNGELLNNVAEINSYTTFEDNNENNPIAVIDTHSVPGNTRPGNREENINTYENDTDAARSLKLEFKNARTLTGTAFIDTTEKEGQEAVKGEERIGNGKLDDGEAKLSGVTVTLREIGKDDSSYDNERKAYTTTTNENGEYRIEGYIPGNYELIYTWGDKDHMVQYYKGTIYNKDRNQNDPYWYKIDVDTRYMDALDNKDIRKQIENEMRGVTINTLTQQIEDAYKEGYNPDGKAIKTTKMNSVTPAIAFSVEYDTTITQVTDENYDKVEFPVKNVDFGIVERAKQALEFRKRISGYKITLANGQVIVDAEIDENGNLKGVHEHTTYLKPSVQSGIIDIGKLKTEMDNELIEGATLETIYEMKVTNVGELDYSTENYYYYGIKGNDSEKVTVSVTELLDYVDGRLNNVNLDKKWTETNQEHLKDVNASKKNADDINKYRTYLTDKLTQPLKPGESNTVNLYTSKLLTSTDDNTFNNEAEISQVEKNKTGFTIGTPVKLINGFFNIGDSEEIVIIPSTGENKSIVLSTIVGITAIVILGIGIILIKKFVINKK